MTAPPYTIDTVEGTDGTEHPSEHLWNPADDDKEHSFLRHDGMLLAAVGPEDEPVGCQNWRVASDQALCSSR